MPSLPNSNSSDRTRDAISIGVLLMAAARGVLLHASDFVLPQDSERVERMRGHEIPWDLPSSFRRDIEHAIGHGLEEAISELQGALDRDDATLMEDWRSFQE